MERKYRFCWPVRPLAEKDNMVQGTYFRFTVLTSRLIRMEYSPEGCFEDRASQSVFYRDFPKVPFAVDRQKGALVLETEHILLNYRENAPFHADTLSLRLKQEPASLWHYGEDFEDLGGTIKTLDTVNGACPVEQGIISRNGFSVLDDSNTLVLEADGWVGVRKENTTDAYFFGYGFDYVAAVQDFFSLTGAPPMLPAYALGNWWSRYHAYTQEEYLELIHRFREEDIPFSVGVVDMDWHLVDIDVPSPLPNDLPGWTGYTWNEKLFPDYKAFIRELHACGLKTALNLHPAAGVRHHEVMYEQMAKAAGMDPATGERVSLDILSPEHMANYFDIIHHPYEEDGVDFWWMDWQQGTDYAWIHAPNKPGQYLDPRERLDPLWMLNHLHILDISRNGKRPMFFSRYAGPGSQRYPVGFSGDTFVTWESLQFQPEFTAKASNIGYCWWSHDIGGHMGGYRDDELFVRWLQLGVLSPINRLHSSNSEFTRKEPWSYGPEAERIVNQWLRLRHGLFPYLYTMNYRTHAQHLPLVQPMYYSHPKCQAAYEVPNQYWFGSELVVAPITQPRNENSGLAKVDVWLPAGSWFDMFTGLHYASKKGRKLQMHRQLDTVPVLAKAGAIVPMARYEKCDNRLHNAPQMDVLVFPGASNRFELYEDMGDYSDYQKGAFAQTNMVLAWGHTARFTIEPAAGDVSLIPEKRSWNIKLRGFHKDIRVSVLVNGSEVSAQICREGNTTCVTVEAAVGDRVELVINGQTLIHDNADVPARINHLLQRSYIGTKEKETFLEICASDEPLHKKTTLMYWQARQTNGVADALKELLSLTQCEYLGDQL